MQTNRRVVVVGASSGLGRHLGVYLTHRGARTALLARSHDRLLAAASEAGSGAVAIACDVTDPAACRNAIEKAAGELGGIDALVYAPGVGPMAPLAEVDAETWHSVFATNVTGAALITSAALPYLTESMGTVVYLSSISASQTPPWPGLGAYAVSKAALDKLAEAWRVEHPTIGFTRVAVGISAGGQGDDRTRFADEWDPDISGPLITTWTTKGYLDGSFVEPDALARVVHDILDNRAGATIPSVVVAGPARPA
ncbi:NADP-dependent 3-hydroxy acid dehydrogenase YdfG [Parafrankia irregularis]|uniref:NADP-dependent 3-hydroxy acid dehydrogenase YdfG n=1 Tax=Parafrankia irregularis TaxID=795642 RepID=A0A0S4QUM8_9ACTN|nr:MULTISPECIES: SDR family oxidoreductase [Parafrankia]MBE3199959.1 SDR family oxidoreductase [Parafrankia sp. CH37]CUU59297.1 NADP-dependent 3-hydroxy acid dehydrogenase YdfG [Parafrankia irregularis]